jgi:hypothetical protein
MNFTNFRNIKAHYDTDSSESSSLISHIGDYNFESNYETTITEVTMDSHTETLETGAAKNADHFDTNNRRSRRSSTSSNISYFSARHTLSLIPSFNGKNIPVTQFTADCRGVYDLVEPDDRLFFYRAVL